ncbi:MAG: hypothetical protein R2762_28870 [Bryobacteraceae bacterium]
MKFSYRLQTLLDRKAEEQEQAERALASAQGELRVQRERLEAERRNQEEIAARRDAFRRQPPATVTAEAMRYRADYLRGLDYDLDQAKDAVYAQRYAVEEAEEKLEQARATLAEATRQAEVLRKHRDKAESRWKREAERKEELEQEEIGSVMFEMRRRPS